MDKIPKGRCQSCDKKFRLELQGQKWIIPYHDVSKPGPNPQCPGAGKAPKD